ncbi:hypothetical protein RJ641_006499 [Dillenia turbinata]|uniref:Uncharacterized protein n=1 Tax=Dillenia turbinata TaxID=194707 RepID=A0AAN8V3U7_9MAGN
MIKRIFYNIEHGDKDEASESSSSSSDSEVEAEATEETELEDDEAQEVKEDKESFSTSSGYESGDSSGNEVDVNSSGLLTEVDAVVTETDKQHHSDNKASDKRDAETLETYTGVAAEKNSIADNWAGCILECKSVFKCRLCPRIVCLTEETLMAHLKSKRHARSEKLLNEGRLKLMLNSDGEIEEERETHAERHARTVAVAKDPGDQKRKNRGRQRQRMRLKRKKMIEDSDAAKAGESSKHQVKKRRKN